MLKLIKVDNLKKILLSTLFFNIVFYKIPVDVFYFNKSDFQNSVFLLIPFVTVFLISLFFYKKIYSNRKLFNILLAISIYLVLSKIFIPLEISELEGNLEKPIELKYSILLEIIFFLFSFLLIKFFKNKYFVNFIIIFSIIILLNTSYYFSRSIASVIKHQYNYFNFFEQNSKLGSKKWKSKYLFNYL